MIRIRVIREIVILLRVIIYILNLEKRIDFIKCLIDSNRNIMFIMVFLKFCKV